MGVQTAFKMKTVLIRQQYQSLMMTEVDTLCPVIWNGQDFRFSLQNNEAE